MKKNDILSKKLFVFFYCNARYISKMYNDLQGKVNCIFTSATRTDPLVFIQFKMSMKSCKHLLDLLKQAFQIGFITRPVKENGIPLYLAYLQIQMIAVNNYFQ